jgi:hypothetical protein
MVERLTAAVQGLFPLVVVLGLRHTAREQGSQCNPPENVQALASSYADRPKLDSPPR